MISTFRAGLSKLFVTLTIATLLAGAVTAADSAAEAAPLGKAADPMDWPSWRGPEQNGISRETGLPDSLDVDDPEVFRWKNPEAATISTPIVMGDKLYVLARAEPGTPREQEAVLCLDTATGKKLWENRFNIFLSDVPAERVAWSSCVGDPATGRVYAMGVCGYFQCLDGETGKTIWSRSLTEEFGLLHTYGGRTNVPVLFDDLVITSGVLINWDELARPAHRFIAMNKNTGEVVWLAGTRPLPEDTTYSTPFLAVVGGQAQMIFGSSDGAVHGFQPRTGKEIWKNVLSPRGTNTSPIVDGSTVYIGQSEENIGEATMGAVLAFDANQTGDITGKNLWLHKEVMVGKSSPLLLDGRLYCVDDSASLHIFDPQTGKPIGRKQKFGTIMKSSLTSGDGKIYLTSATTWSVLKPNDRGVQKLKQGRFESQEDCQGSPVISHGRVFVPTTDALYCFGLADAKPAVTARPSLPEETPVADDPHPAWLQIVPCDVLIKPGDEQQFAVRLFNARGQLVKEEPATFAVTEGGSIDSTGKLTTAGAKPHTALMVTAKVGDLSGTARVRLVPALPWKFDFADKQVPITWIGARHRHIVREVDGRPLMVKVTTIPKGTRSSCWMGQPDLHDYTIEADVLGNANGDKVPDIGLIAQRYTLAMMGAKQQLQIRSWTSELKRMSVTVPFDWKADTWYTIKFRAANEGGKAVLKGKVWPKDSTEPSDWQITAVDETPSTVGSPGLFGNAGNAEIFISRVSVTPNEEAVSQK
ncbi:MAG: PQQ-binding-like beta-propeller repeat protein [Pirellulales bacterium]